MNGGQDVDVGFKDKVEACGSRWFVCRKFTLSSVVKERVGVCEEVARVCESPRGGVARGLTWY